MRPRQRRCVDEARLVGFFAQALQQLHLLAADLVHGLQPPRQAAWVHTYLMGADALLAGSVTALADGRFDVRQHRFDRGGKGYPEGNDPPIQPQALEDFLFGRKCQHRDIGSGFSHQ